MDLIPLLGVLAAMGALYFGQSFLYDYRISRQGVEFLLFRRWVVYKIPRERILTARMAVSWDCLFMWRRHFQLGNRPFRVRHLTLQTASGNWLSLTPKDPEQALERLGVPEML